MIERARLERFDAQGIKSVLALTYVPLRRPGGSLANPRAFVCEDGKTYWVKRNSQHGLVSELVGGRLAHRVSVGPMATVVDVPSPALPASGEANHLLGMGVGVLDIPDTENSKDLHALIAPAGPYDPAIVDEKSMAAVVVFQTWLGVGDNQALVHMKNGRIYSIDHGECFSDVAQRSDPSVVVVSLPAVSPDLGRRRTLTSPMVDAIEALSDDDVLRAVAQVPQDAAWGADIDRRVQIAEWLSHRRGRLREVIDRWAT